MGKRCTCLHLFCLRRSQECCRVAPTRRLLRNECLCTRGGYTDEEGKDIESPYAYAGVRRGPLRGDTEEERRDSGRATVQALRITGLRAAV